MADIALLDEKLDIYQSHSRALSWVDGELETIIDKENALFNETLKDYLRHRARHNIKIEQYQIYDFVNKLDAEVHDAMNSGIDPNRFDPEAIKRSFCSLRVYVLEELGQEAASDGGYHILAMSIPTKNLSLVERQILTRHFKGEYEIGSQLLGWRYAKIYVEEGITQDDIDTWVSRRYIDAAWRDLDFLLKQDGIKRRVLPWRLIIKDFISSVFGYRSAVDV